MSVPGLLTATDANAEFAVKGQRKVEEREEESSAQCQTWERPTFRLNCSEIIIRD